MCGAILEWMVGNMATLTASYEQWDSVASVAWSFLMLRVGESVNNGEERTEINYNLVSVRQYITGREGYC